MRRLLILWEHDESSDRSPLWRIVILAVAILIIAGALATRWLISN